MAEARVRDGRMHQSRDETALRSSFFAVAERLLSERRLDEMPFVNKVEVQG